MDQKRILVFTESYLPAVGGLENNTLLLCKTLSNLGHFITLITPQKNALKNQEFLVMESNSKVQYLKYVKTHDLVIVNGGIAFKIIIPCILFNKPYLVIYQMASLFHHIHANSFKIKLSNQVRKWLAKKATLNIGVSEYSYQELKHYFGERKAGLLINPANPIFENLGPKSIEENNFKCLFAGRLIAGKGIRLLIEAVEKLRVQNHPIQLHIIGEGPEEEYIKSKLSSGYIFLYPPAQPVDLKNLYHASHLTIIPSTTHIEGSPLVMAESISMGTPVLVSSQPAMVASIKDQRLVFKTGKVMDLCQKIKELLEDSVYEELLQQTLTLAQDYSYKNYIAQLQKIIRV
jgi:glycosyltransferase involved in cell wall biosynthesis